MKDVNDLSKGSGSLYGSNDFLGGIRKSEDGRQIKKAEEIKDELEKSDKE